MSRPRPLQPEGTWIVRSDGTYVVERGRLRKLPPPQPRIPQIVQDYMTWLYLMEDYDGF